MFVCPECGASQPVPGNCPADRTPLAQVTDDVLLGQTIGAYRVARLLGVGGMGRVYKGVQPQIGSRVAIKVLSRECSDRRDLVDRFFAEAKAVNLIRHESIVNVLDLSVLPDGRPYIIMEYLDGAPLSAILEAARHNGTLLPLGGVARLVAEVLDALHAAHAKGIVHRDLKPDNIYITPSGRAKVLDFGIAKLQPELGGSATHTGSLLGTPHYMSPEQAAGRPVDARADIYAMGVILFECATLHRPFTADSLYSLLRMHVEVPPPSPRAARPDMPIDMEHVIYTALAKAPEQRFAAAGAMSAALQHATSTLPQEAWTPVTPAGGVRSGGWSPTPPASWAKPSTVSSGQVTAPQQPAKKSGKGVWIGVGAAVVIGGIVAVGVAASGGGGAVSGSGSGSSSGSGSAIAESGSGSGSDPWANGTPPAPHEEVPQPPEPSSPPTPPSDDQEGQEILEGYLEGVDQKDLPPELKKALAKYGSYQKIPKAERAKLAGKLLARTQNMTGDIAKQVDDALSDVPSAPPAPAPSDGWFVRHNLAVPGFNAKKVKIDQTIAWALAEAKRNVPDATLTWIDVAGVFPDGHADLTLPNFASDHGDMTLRFISPSHVRRDPSLPRGVAQKYEKCSFYIVISPTEAEIYDTSDEMLCTYKPVARPRCSIAAIWKSALAKKPDLSDAVASLVYKDWNGHAGWDFTIREGTKPPLYSETIPDDCK